MAWSSPRTWVSGELVTAALGNAHWRDNLSALYGGSMSIASQAALDFVYASSSTQLARLAKGTALQYIRMNAAATGYEFADLGTWVTPDEWNNTGSFSAANFTTSNSPTMTWTVQAADVTNVSYTIIGKTMVVCWNINTAAIGGTPAGGNYLKILIPASKTANKGAQVAYRAYDPTASAWAFALASVSASGTYINLFNDAGNAGTWGVGDAGAIGEIVFEIQ